jgi:hypothetical protein
MPVSQQTHADLSAPTISQIGVHPPTYVFLQNEPKFLPCPASTISFIFSRLQATAGLVISRETNRFQPAMSLEPSSTSCASTRTQPPGPTKPSAPPARRTHFGSSRSVQRAIFSTTWPETDGLPALAKPTHFPAPVLPKAHLFVRLLRVNFPGTLWHSARI